MNNYGKEKNIKNPKLKLRSSDSLQIKHGKQEPQIQGLSPQT
jgi:hypothetical protein